MIRRVLTLLALGGCYDPQVSLSATDARLDAGLDGGGGPCPIDSFSTLDPAQWKVTAITGINPTATAFGKLGFAMPKDAQGFARVSSVGTYDLTRTTLEIELVQPPDNAQSTSAATFGMSLDDPNANAYTISVHAKTVFTETVIGGVSSPGNQTLYQPLAHRHLRIRAVPSGAAKGFDVVFEASANRVIWTPLDQLPAAFDLTAVHAAIAAGSTATLTFQQFAEFDNFEAIDQTCTPSLLAPFASDGFTAADMELVSHPAPSGGAWSRVGPLGGDLAIVNNRVEHDNALPALYATAVMPTDPDYDVEAEVFPTSIEVDATGVAGRVFDDGQANGYFAMLATGSGATVLQLGKVTEDATLVFTSCAALPVQPVLTTAHRVRLRMRGSEITGWYDGDMLCDENDSTFAMSGNPGVRRTDGVMLPLDNFLVTPK